MAATKEQRRQAARLIAEGHSHGGAARSVGIDPRTMRRWLSDHTFVAQVEAERKRIAYDEHRRMLNAYGSDHEMFDRERRPELNDRPLTPADLKHPDPFRTPPGRPPAIAPPERREISDREAQENWALGCDWRAGRLTDAEYEQAMDDPSSPLRRRTRTPVIRVIPVGLMEGHHSAETSWAATDPFAPYYS